MAHPAKHIIHTLRFELISDDKAYALRLQDEVSDMMQKELPALLEQTLNEAGLSNLHILFKKISLKLDPIPPGQLKNELRRQLPSVLARELSRMITRSNLDQVHRNEVRTSDEKEYAAEILARYLITGIWPGAELSPGRSPDEWLKHMLEHAPEGIPVLMEQIRSHHARAAARLAAILAPGQLTALIERTVKPGRSAIYINLHRSMELAISKLALKVDINSAGWKTAAARFIIESMLRHLNVVKPAESPIIDMLAAFADHTQAPPGLFRATPQGKVVIHPRIVQVIDTKTTAMSWKQATESLFFLADTEDDLTSHFVAVRSPKPATAHRKGITTPEPIMGSPDTGSATQEELSVVPALSPEERSDMLAESIRLSRGMTDSKPEAESHSLSRLLYALFPGSMLAPGVQLADSGLKVPERAAVKITPEALKRMVIWLRSETVKRFKSALEDPATGPLVEWRTALLADSIMTDLPVPVMDAVLAELFPTQIRMIRYLDTAIGSMVKPLLLPVTESSLRKVLLIHYIHGVPSGSAGSARYAVYRAVADLLPANMVVPFLQALTGFGEVPETAAPQDSAQLALPFIPLLKKFADQWPSTVGAFPPDMFEKWIQRDAEAVVIEKQIRASLRADADAKAEPELSSPVVQRLRAVMRETALRPDIKTALDRIDHPRAVSRDKPEISAETKFTEELSILAKIFPRGVFRTLIRALADAKENRITNPEVLQQIFAEAFRESPYQEVIPPEKPEQKEDAKTIPQPDEKIHQAEPGKDWEDAPQKDKQKKKEDESPHLTEEQREKPVADAEPSMSDAEEAIRRFVMESLRAPVSEAEWALDWLRQSLDLPLKSLAELTDDQAKALFTVYVAEGEIPAELILEGVVTTRDAIIEWLGKVVYGGYDWLYPVLVKTMSITAAIRRLAEALDSGGMMQVYRILTSNNTLRMKHIAHFNALLQANSPGVDDRVIMVKALMIAALNPKADSMQYVPFLRSHLRIAEMEFDRPAHEWFTWWEEVKIPPEWNVKEFKASLEILRKQVSERKVRPDFSKGGKPDSESSRTVLLEDKIAVDNAGVVLLNPFIPHLFKMTGLLNDRRQFISEEHAWEGIKMLHFAVTKQKNTPEHAILLSKVICGLPPDWLPPDQPELDDKHIELIDSMLQAVIDQWKALGKSSFENLRGSFLFRRGLLHEDELKWNLTVEQKPWDLLLDKVPWTFGMVKFPWMNKRLQVTWR